ncbi:hypothetical protein PIROE2DRAFT_6542 [Piromyces sp. E2]|nr:hypothetical protein PIROE2DRAFT_6542 [Piromyces sp. E2]|eukprot:OUM66304.1 hypothetical protein PIROE2DRAFT_6542 [Piromyces sp. E2]
MKPTDNNSNNNTNHKKKGSISNTSINKTKSPIMFPLKYPNKMFSKNEKGKHNKHISIPIFNMKNNNRSSSVTLSSPIMAISKITSQLKSTINSNHRRSKSGNNISFKTNNHSNSETSSISSGKKSKHTIPLSLPVAFRNNSVKEEGNSETVSTPKINGVSSVYTRSYGRCSASTPALSYSTSGNTTPKSSKSSKSSITKNEPLYIPRANRKLSLNSLSKAITSKITSSPLINPESEPENETLSKKTRKIDHPSIKSKTSQSVIPHELLTNTNTSTNDKFTIKNNCNNQSNGLNNRKNIQRNKNNIPNKIGSTDTVGSTNSNCTTFCTNTSCDKLTDSKDISLSQGIENNSNETINKECTFSMFMPKTVIGKNSLQHSMQREINGIIERFDQTSLNDISGLDQESIRVNGNNLLLTALNNDLKKSKNKNILKNGEIMDANINGGNIMCTDESLTELNNSTLEDQKIYISDIDIACLDLNKIRADLSENISESINYNSGNTTITVAPITVTPFNNIPNATNSPISSNQKGLNSAEQSSKNKQDIQSSDQNNDENPEIHIITATTTNANNTKNNNHTNVNNKKNNNYSDGYLNEIINHQSLTKLLHGEVKTAIIDDDDDADNKDKHIEASVQNNNNKNDDKDQKPKLSKRTSSLNRLMNNGSNKNDKKENVIDRKEANNVHENSDKKPLKKDNENTVQKPLFNNFKHQSQPLQGTSSYFTHRHHFSEGYRQFLSDDNKNGKLINNTDNQIESLNSLKTALLFLSKNENDSTNNDNGKKNGSSSNKKSDSGSSIFSKRKSTNTLSTLNSQNTNNKKYLSLPTLFTSNTIMPLNDNEEDMFENCKVMYPVSRLDSGRKLRAYYGIDCPIFLGNGSKSKMTNYYGANLYEELEKNKEDKKKSPKFGIRRLTSFLHLSNNDLASQESPKSKLKNEIKGKKLENFFFFYYKI